jgi:hypothetical protein
MVGAFLPKISLALMILLMFSIMRNVLHLYSCFIDLLLQLRQLKHLFSSILHMLVYGFKVVDFLVQLLILWCWASSLPFFWLRASFKRISSWLVFKGARTTSGTVVFFGDMTKVVVNEFTGDGR